MTARWRAVVAAARQRDAAARVPLHVRGRTVGGVATAHLPALTAWPHWLHLGDAAVMLTATDPDRALAEMNAELRAQGHIRAWRDETFPLFDPATREPLARMERAATRFWGTLTLGAHLNGYVADATGIPTQMWIAQRSFGKPTDPGAFDNLVGGGVPAGQSPAQALVREAWEEAGLLPAEMHGVRPARVLRLHRDIPEGLQFEDLHTWDLALPQGWQPQNQDGEVAGFRLLPIAEAMALATSGAMTVDAALVTLDFGARHGLLRGAIGPLDRGGDTEAQALTAALFSLTG